MLSFIIRRLLIIIPMALLVVTVTWGLIRMAPGSFYSGEKKLPPAIEANIKKKYGLDKPWYQQYFIMMGNVVRGDFGDSLKYQDRSVNQIIRDHLPYSATIGLLGYLLALAVGLAAGIIAALKQNSAFDYGSMAFAMLGLSVPNFVLGPILVLVFSLWLFVLPPARWGGVSSIILPVLTLSAIYMAYIARLTRAGMLEIMRSDYIRTARVRRAIYAI
jgi:oligopeptide transport system permease protein